jgi:hypothetical protein
VRYRAVGIAEPLSVSVEEMSSIAFESVASYRRVRSYRRQRNFCGEWWMATTNRHVTFESWCERDHLVALDFDPEIVDTAAQPFGFAFTDENGAEREHVPDFFCRTATGAGVVVDVRPEKLIGSVDQRKFDATARLCHKIGWTYRRVGELPIVWIANVRWLAGYRHPRVYDATAADAVRGVLHRSPATALGALANTVGNPVAVLPTIFHLLWSKELVADLSSAKLSLRTPLSLGRPR